MIIMMMARRIVDRPVDTSWSIRTPFYSAREYWSSDPDVCRRYVSYDTMVLDDALVSLTWRGDSFVLCGDDDNHDDNCYYSGRSFPWGPSPYPLSLLPRLLLRTVLRP